MTDRPAISIVVISWFKPDRLKACLNSIVPLLDFDVDDICIIDNSHKVFEGHEEVRKEVVDYLNNLTFPSKVILNPENYRFSKAVNQGIESTKNRFIFLVNNDTEVVDKETFNALSNECINRPKAATVTPVTVHGNGRVYCSGAFGRGGHKRDKPKNVRETEWNNFAFVCIDRNVIDEIGVLETGKATLRGRKFNCRHYHSDEEWCRRASAAGYVHLVHPIMVNHYHKEG